MWKTALVLLIVLMSPARGVAQEISTDRSYGAEWTGVAFNSGATAYPGVELGLAHWPAEPAGEPPTFAQVGAIVGGVAGLGVAYMHFAGTDAIVPPTQIAVIYVLPGAVVGGTIGWIIDRWLPARVGQPLALNDPSWPETFAHAHGLGCRRPCLSQHGPEPL